MTRNRCKAVFFIGIFCLVNVSVARADAAKIPSRPEMLAKFQARWGATPDDYFKARDDNRSLDNCRKVLSTVQAEYEKARTQEKPDFARMDALMQGTDDQLNFRLDRGNEPTSLQALLNKCGPCVAKVRNTEGDIFDSFVWCRPTKTPDADRALAVPNIRDYLLTLKNYERDNYYIIQFTGRTANGEQTDAMKEADKKPRTTSPFTAYISVRASMPGVSLAMGYYARCSYDFPSKDPVANFNLRFKAMDDEFLLLPPKLIEDAKTNSKLDTAKLGTVEGGWFADAAGNLAYDTNADFSTFTLSDGFADFFAQLGKGFVDMQPYALRVIMSAGYTVFAQMFPKDLPPAAKVNR